MKKDNTSDSNESKEAKAIDLFSELLIEKLEGIQADWKKPWFNPNGGGGQWPKNTSGRSYNGGNAILLSLVAEKKNYPHSIWATFDRINAMNFSKDKQGKFNRLTGDDGKPLPHIGVNKGEKSTPVWITTYSVVNPLTKERLSYENYRQMSEEERSKYNVYPKMKVYGVFNLSQTNIKEVRPDLYDKIVAKSSEEKQPDFKFEEGGITEFPAFDRMIKNQLWICPIKEVPGDDAYYSISKHEIVVPPRENFKNYESFVGNALHEVNHSVHSENYLNLLKPATFNSREYSVEELRAELGAAVLCNKFGLTKNIKSDSLPYIKSWLDNIHENPEFLKSIMMDVKRSASFISQRIDRIQMDIDKGIESNRDEYIALNNSQSRAKVLDESKTVESKAAKGVKAEQVGVKGVEKHSEQQETQSQEKKQTEERRQSHGRGR